MAMTFRLDERATLGPLVCVPVPVQWTHDFAAGLRVWSDFLSLPFAAAELQRPKRASAGLYASRDSMHVMVCPTDARPLGRFTRSERPDMDQSPLF